MKMRERDLQKSDRAARTGARGLRSILEGILLETIVRAAWPEWRSGSRDHGPMWWRAGHAPLYTYSDKQPREQTAS